MDERRIQRTGQLLSEYSNLETKVMPIIQKCLDNIKGFGNSVNGPEVFDRCMLKLMMSVPFRSHHCRALLEKTANSLAYDSLLLLHLKRVANLLS